MAGDSKCRDGRFESDDTIRCYTSDGEYTGIRHAMTDQQFQMYMHKENMEQRQLLQNQQRSNNKKDKKPLYCIQGSNLYGC